jgi:acyl carrier protein
MAVVAETTGYPAEMLGLQMELESDLGIDSIKRVEILSAVRDRTPGLSEVDSSALAQLRTLGQVVDHLRASLPTAAPAAPAATPAAGATRAAAAPAAEAAGAPATAAPAASDVERIVMAVVAETTGYPAEMLGLQMELESDLGIDSIKRTARRGCPRSIPRRSRSCARSARSSTTCAPRCPRPRPRRPRATRRRWPGPRRSSGS